MGKTILKKSASYGASLCCYSYFMQKLLANNLLMIFPVLQYVQNLTRNVNHLWH